MGTFIEINLQSTSLSPHHLVEERDRKCVQHSGTTGWQRLGGLTGDMERRPLDVVLTEYIQTIHEEIKL